MGKCRTCGNQGEDVSVLLVEHDKLGKIMICQECWVKLHEEHVVRSTYS
ncbi:MAG: hypothetical protein ACE5KO_01555 [Candidatus Bathyarchaeia archaeon]